MADIFSTGVSGLLAAQVGMSTVSHNVANVNTAGYSRQLVTFATRPAEGMAGFYVGTGVDTVAVQRAYSQFLNNTLTQAGSGLGRAEQLADLSGRLNTQLSGSANLQQSLDTFYGAVQDMANTPSDAATREVLLARANGLASTFNSLSGQFSQLGQEIEQQITDTVGTINNDSAAIARLNSLIRDSAAGSGTPSPDLLDQRDALVNKLAGEVGITVMAQNDHTINIVVGNGQSLVTGTTAHALETTPNRFDATRVDVAGAESGSVISGRIGGGSLGALLEFRQNTLDPAKVQLGRAAQALASAFNTQHAQGLDLAGNVGGAFFSVGGPVSLAADSNAGSAALTVDIEDIGSLNGASYEMQWDGAAWTLRDNHGAPVAMTGSGSAADPFRFAGLSVEVGGTPAQGDAFRIEPSRDAGGSLRVLVTDPSRIAAAAPFVTTVDAANTGTAAPRMEIANGADPALFDPVAIEFTSATTYTVNGGAAQTYTPGQPIEANGWRMTLDGTPATGDKFNVAANANAEGDNANALKLGDIAGLGVLDHGTTSVSRAYSQLVGQVGSAGAIAKDTLASQQATYTNALGAQQSLSGVNLDEEAANLLRYQQAYQASAQVISAANTLFQALIGAVRG